MGGTPLAGEIEAAARLAIAGLVGLAVGLEREWSGHADGPKARFAGLRTFLLLGIVGGCAGLMLERMPGVMGAALAGTLVAGAAALSVGAYVMAVRRPDAELDGTTEAAALVVVALGAVAGVGWLALAAGTGAVVVLALREKSRLHWLVGRVREGELRAALQFAVLALVVLPLLPAETTLGPVALRPRALWAMVMLFSGLDFAGFVARRVVGPRRGYEVTGLLGGLVSSTAVTLGFARRSRDEPSLGGPLALGVVGACAVLIPRVLVVSAALAPAVAMELARLLAPAALAGAAVVAWGWGRRGRRAGAAEAQSASPAEGEERTPLRLGPAIRMAAAFQGAILLVGLMRGAWGESGLYVTASLLGLTDTDALTVSLSRPGGVLAAETAARAIAVGVASNTLVKLGVALALGTARFRRVAGAGLATLAGASLLGLAM